MDGDNGKVKTPEQERLERYQKDPNSFVERSELILAVKRSPEGVQYFIGNTTAHELKVIKYGIDLRIDSVIGSMIMASKSKIIQPHGIMNFARGKK